MKPLVHYFIHFLLVLLLIACSSDKDQPAEPSTPIVGTVTLFDIVANEAEVREIENKEGVLVEVSGEDFSFTTTTNRSGVFSFPDIPQGKLLFTFKKDGYVGFDSLRFTHELPVDSLNFIELVELPPATVSLLGVSHEDDLVFLWQKIDFQTNEWILASAWWFFSKSPDVSSSLYQYSYIDCCSGGNSSNPNGSAHGFSLQEFYNHGFKPGDIVYAVAYPGSTKRIWYENPEDGYPGGYMPTYGKVASNQMFFELP